MRFLYSQNAKKKGVYWHLMIGAQGDCIIPNEGGHPIPSRIQYGSPLRTLLNESNENSIELTPELQREYPFIHNADGSLEVHGTSGGFIIPNGTPLFMVRNPVFEAEIVASRHGRSGKLLLQSAYGAISANINDKYAMGIMMSHILKQDIIIEGDKMRFTDNFYYSAGANLILESF